MTLLLRPCCVALLCFDQSIDSSKNGCWVNHGHLTNSLGKIMTPPFSIAFAALLFFTLSASFCSILTAVFFTVNDFFFSTVPVSAVAYLGPYNA